MELRAALRLDRHRTVAFVGAGGKSSALKRLGFEIADQGTVLLTTSTKLALTQSNLAPHHFILREAAELHQLPQLLDRHRAVLVTAGRTPGESKWLGLRPRMLTRLRDVARSSGSWLLVEADGGRGRSLKAPGEHEPVIPEFVDLVVPMAGLDAVGAALTDEWVHRPGLAVNLLDVEQGSLIKARHVAGILGHADGGLKGIPKRAEVRPYLNKAETGRGLTIGTEVAEDLLSIDRIQAVVVGAARGEPARRVVGRVAGVVLAAGGSNRLGKPKQLIEWRGEALVWHSVQAALEAGLSTVAVVVGGEEQAVRDSLAGLPVILVRNPAWRGGQSTSVRAGLEAVQADVEGVVFLLADMPFVTQDLIRTLVLKHRETLSSVAPVVEGRRGNPVLFDRRTFGALSEIEGDRGGRQILGRFSLEEIPWDPDSQFDLDTDEDLRWLQAQSKSPR
jgi:molybdenum cofactor cytidylyltransferase